MLTLPWLASGSRLVVGGSGVVVVVVVVVEVVVVVGGGGVVGGERVVAFVVGLIIVGVVRFGLWKSISSM